MKDRTNILWVSCLDKERSIREIAETWKYKSPIGFYRDFLPQKMVEMKLWKIVKIEMREAHYQSIFDGYFDWLKQLEPDDEKVNLLIKDKEIFLKFFEENKTLLFSLDLVKIFFKNDVESAKELGHLLPMISLSTIISLCYFVKKGIASEKNYNDLPGIFSMLNILQIIDFRGYVRELLKRLSLDKLESWSYLLDTELGKHLINVFFLIQKKV
jgi:membrane protein CcdC involved in cytochrome C biogenesis